MAGYLASDFMLDFSFAVPPGEKIYVTVEQSSFVETELVPMCQRLKGEVLSCFSDVERYLESIISLLIAGRNQYVSVEFVHREMIRPLNADKKIELARKISAQLPDELKPDSKLFNSIDAMRTLRNSFAHGAILLQPVGNSVRAYPARDPGTTIDLAFARMVDEQAQWLLQALANWRHVLEPVDGIDVEAVCA